MAAYLTAVRMLTPPLKGLAQGFPLDDYTAGKTSGHSTLT